MNNQYMLLEHSSNEIKIKSEGEHICLEGIFTQFQNPNDPNDVNENGRVYTFEGKYPFKPHYEKLKHLIDNGYIVCGSLDHPDSDAAEMNTAAFVIEKYEYIPDKNHIWGRIKILNTIPYGHNAKEFINANKRIFISSRALGEIKEGKFASINQLITYDLVSVPGMKLAEMKKVNEDLNIINKNIDVYQIENTKTLELLTESHNRFQKVHSVPIAIPIVGENHLQDEIENDNSVTDVRVRNANQGENGNVIQPIKDQIETRSFIVDTENSLDASVRNADQGKNSIEKTEGEYTKREIEVRNLIMNVIIDSKDKLFLLGAMFKNNNPIIMDDSLTIEYDNYEMTFDYRPNTFSGFDRLEIDITNEDDPKIISLNGKLYGIYKDVFESREYDVVKDISTLKFGDIIWFGKDESDSDYANRVEKLIDLKLIQNYFDYEKMHRLLDVSSEDEFKEKIMEYVEQQVPRYQIAKKYLVAGTLYYGYIDWLELQVFDEKDEKTKNKMATMYIPINWKEYKLPDIWLKTPELNEDIRIIKNVHITIDNDNSSVSEDLKNIIRNNIRKFKNINEIGKISFVIDDENEEYRYDVRKSNENQTSFDLRVEVIKENKTLYDVTYKITEASELFEYINRIQ